MYTDNNSNELYCTNCNNKISQGNKFCSYCGNMISKNINNNINGNTSFKESNDLIREKSKKII